VPAPMRLVLLGHPVSHSLSPAIQNAALAAAGLPARYAALDVPPAELETVLDALRAERVAGNVTVPFKERVHARCDVLTPLAARVGAVNTFWVDDAARLNGDNTDVGGFTRAATDLLGAPPRDLSVGVLGAGGAAAAVLAAGSASAASPKTTYNRTPERARILCERFGSVAQPVDDAGVIAGAQLVVNATSIGLQNDALPIAPALIPPGAFVVDLVYRRGATAFVRALRRRGVRAIDGSAMLVEQAALAFERWFGRPPDRAVMWSAMPD